MYKITYTENGKEMERVIPVAELGAIMTELREKGINNYRIQDNKNREKPDQATKSSVF